MEYYDVRHAMEAKRTLSGRTLFGVKLTLTSRDYDEESRSEDQAYDDDDNDQEETHVQTVDSSSLSYSLPTPTAPTTSTSCVPFPSSQPQLEQDNSNTSNHECFVFSDRSGQARPRSISADNDSSISADPSSGLVPGARYPKSFSSNSGGLYTSSSVCDTHSQVDPHRRRFSNNHFFDAAHSQTQERQDRPRCLIADIPADFRIAVDEPDTTVTPTVSSTSYPQHHQQPTSCFYNTPHDNTTYFAPHYNPSSQVPSAPMHFPLPPHSQNFVFEHANLHNWTWMPAASAGPMSITAAVPKYYIPSSLSPVTAGGMYYPAHVGEFHLSENSSEGVEYNPPYPQKTHFRHYPLYPEPVPSPSTFQDAHTSSPLASTHLSDAPEVAQSRLHESSSIHVNERNELNLARIENGQDTRTTVMVKNIPNTMSDKDLIAYIGNVCPRRIDFLYLRMDFQNGKWVTSYWSYGRWSYHTMRQNAMWDMLLLISLLSRTYWNLRTLSWG